MNMRYLVALAAGLSIVGVAFAEDGEALAKKGDCMTCHAVNKKVVGPAFWDVALKYKDDKGAQSTLEKKVRSGGSGNWGKMPMPATTKAVSDEDIKSIVQWVLGGKASSEFVNEKTENAAQAARQRAAEDARQREEDARNRKEAQDREIKVAAFRKSIKEGDDTSAGVVIEVKGNLIKIQTNDSQCSQRDYDNNCKNWINTPVEKWFKRSEVYPQ